MLAKRIIPCLDVDAGRVVKGVNFVDLVDAGDPVEQALFYDQEQADELVFLDITASSDNRDTMYEMVRRTSEQVFIPFTVGGGIRSVDDMKKIISGGADKVGINTAAVKRPQLIREGADKFGTQCIVVAIDAKRAAGGTQWEVFVNGGRTPTGLDAEKWAAKCEELGAGEILLQRRPDCVRGDNPGSQYTERFHGRVQHGQHREVVAGAGLRQSVVLRGMEKGDSSGRLAVGVYKTGSYSRYTPAGHGVLPPLDTVSRIAPNNRQGTLGGVPLLVSRLSNTSIIREIVSSGEIASRAVGAMRLSITKPSLDCATPWTATSSESIRHSYLRRDPSQTHPPIRTPSPTSFFDGRGLGVAL